MQSGKGCTGPSKETNIGPKFKAPRLLSGGVAQTPVELILQMLESSQHLQAVMYEAYQMAMSLMLLYTSNDCKSADPGGYMSDACLDTAQQTFPKTTRAALGKT